MKTILFILGLIILVAGISTLAGGAAYTFGPKDMNPNSYGSNASNKDIELGNIKVFKISIAVLGVAILSYALLYKFGNKVAW